MAVNLFHHKEQLAYKIVRHVPARISPQQLSYLRLLLAWPLIWSLINGLSALALSIFVFCALLDYLDGPLARLTNRVTNWGKLLDPFADKVIALPVIIILGPTMIPSVLIWLLLGLEILLIAMSLILKPIFEQLGWPRSLGANIFGKYKFTIQVLLILWLFLAPVNSSTQLVAVTLAVLACLLAGASIIKHALPERLHA